MRRTGFIVRAAAIGLLACATAARAEARLTAADLAGTWAGTLAHDGDTTSIALGLEPDSTGRLTVIVSVPATHFDRIPIGRVAPEVEGDSVRIGGFRFRFDPADRTLSGTMPPSFVPVYAIPIVLRKVERFDPPPRPPLRARQAEPLWAYDAGSPLWAGPTFAHGRLYVGAESGRVLALDAGTGAALWSFTAGGRVRTRPVAGGDDVYFQADDGYLYALSAANGAQRWRVKIVDSTIVRLPFDNPRSRYDRFGSDVTVVGARLYVGTHDGKVLALDPADGRRIWEFAAGEAVLAAPRVAGDRVLFGSYDHHVYALAAATGALIWKRDTQGAVVSTPAVAGDRVVVGNRCYDLLGLDLATGAVAWKRYVWMSWIESSATIRNGVAYVGSSDAAAAYAFDAKSGRRWWATDVFGWAWGQPAVTSKRVYVGISGQVGYPVHHAGGLMALDRQTGAVRWQFAIAAPDSGAFGVPGSPAVGAGRVFVASLDGHVYAFEE